MKKLLSEHLGCEESSVTLGASLTDDLGADDTDVVEIVMAAEEAFGVEIPDEDAERLVTVADLVACIERLTK